MRKVKSVVKHRLLSAYKARKQRAAVSTSEHALTVARTMLKRTKYCFLVTRGLDGWCSAWLVQPIVDAETEFVLWFGTDPTLRKVRELETDARATVAVGDGRENANLVLYGRARLEREVAVRQRRWRNSWRMFFPGGPVSENYVVIRFEAERLELMNFNRNVIPEPFGLCPLTLIKRAGRWAVSESAA